MRTNLMLCATFALSILLVGCDDNRTADFCNTICECADGNGAQTCVNECNQIITILESSNAGAPIVSDECFACAKHATCEIAFISCSSECATLLDKLTNSPEPQPGDPLDQPTN